MSGLIYGMIATGQLPFKQPINMQQVLGCYKIDRYLEIKEANAFIGCGLLHITKENETETLPLYNKDHTQLIAADVILDNRQELYEALGLNMGEAKSDSELILLAYEKWGVDCPNYLIGDFSFIIWNKAKEEIFCARDATGTRTFYYTFEEGTFYFGSVIKAITALNAKVTAIHTKWIVNFLSNEIPLNQFDCESTPYEGIKQLPPAHSLLIREHKLLLTQYWQPLKTVKPLKLPNDTAYHEAFLKLFKECVDCRLTTNNGILLSGGLDSSSIASLAATTLQKKQQSLEAFSAIPIQDYKDYVIEGRIANESTYIEALTKLYPNIHVHYCRAEGQTALSDLEQLLEIFEYPYKMIENITWYRQAIKEAKASGCKVLLNGQFGNNTISYGNFLTQSLTLIHQWQWWQLLKEIKSFSGAYHLPRKKVLKKVLTTAVPYKLKKLLKYKQVKNFNYFRYTLLKTNILKQYELKKSFERIYYYQYPEYFMDLKEERKVIMNLINFTQIASMEMKLSLEQGILIRDPSRDKRLIEFCLSLPGEQFMKDGVERRLIRSSMVGILPECIRSNITMRGIQGADKLQRIQSQWPLLYAELEEFALAPQLSALIDQEKYHAHLKALNKPLEEKDWPEVKMYLLLYICNQFFRTQNV